MLNRIEIWGIWRSKQHLELRGHIYITWFKWSNYDFSLPCGTDQIWPMNVQAGKSFKIEIYTSSESWINKLSIDVWFVRIGQYLAEIKCNQCMRARGTICLLARVQSPKREENLRWNSATRQMLSNIFMNFYKAWMWQCDMCDKHLSKFVITIIYNYICCVVNNKKHWGPPK